MISKNAMNKIVTAVSTVARNARKVPRCMKMVMPGQIFIVVRLEVRPIWMIDIN